LNDNFSGIENNEPTMLVKKSIIIKKCACGCGKDIIISSRHPETKYLRGHQRWWLGKKG